MEILEVILSAIGVVLGIVFWWKPRQEKKQVN